MATSRITFVPWTTVKASAKILILMYCESPFSPAHFFRKARIREKTKAHDSLGVESRNKNQNRQNSRTIQYTLKYNQNHYNQLQRVKVLSFVYEYNNLTVINDPSNSNISLDSPFLQYSKSFIIFDFNNTFSIKIL